VKVKKLILMLSKLDPDEQIVAQYITAKQSGYAPKDLGKIARALMEDDDFKSEHSLFLDRWMEQAADELGISSTLNAGERFHNGTSDYFDDDDRETCITNLDERTWIEEYGLVKNPKTGAGLFENKAKQVKFVKEYVSLNRVWSWLPAEEEDAPELIRNGFYSDALGYYITEAPYNPKETTVVPINDED
jgi:hypothetical protein